MNSLQTFLLSLACLTGGVVLLALGKAEAMAATLIAAATGGLIAAKVQDQKRVAEKAAAAAEEMEKTQTLRRQVWAAGEEPKA